MPLVNTDVEGVLTISTISMNPANGAWGIVGDERGEGGLVKLWADFDVRGQDRVLPGATGVIAYPRRMTVTRHDLRLIVVGDVIGQTGAAETVDTRSALRANLEYLRLNVFLPVVSPVSGIRVATLTVPGAANRAADIHVDGVVTQSYALAPAADPCSPSIWVGTLQISIPGGRFA
jgi:hypothetical protein